jgi:hypothetical protein
VGGELQWLAARLLMATSSATEEMGAETRAAEYCATIPPFHGFLGCSGIGISPATKHFDLHPILQGRYSSLSMQGMATGMAWKKCDLCKHQNVHSDNDLLCESCAEMIERLLAVQEPTETLEPDETALAAAPRTGTEWWCQWYWAEAAASLGQLQSR